jgi:hypothetical protein
MVAVEYISSDWVIARTIKKPRNPVILRREGGFCRSAR